jgi:hypothetical protein
MSHFTTVKTHFKDIKDLVYALTTMGFDENHIEVSEENDLDLIGYDNAPRMLNGKRVKGIIRINRKHVGKLSNDLGFCKEADGTYTALISDYDSSKYNERWLGQLKQNYVVKKATKQLKKQGYRVKMITKEDNTIQLRCTL